MPRSPGPSFPGARSFSVILGLLWTAPLSAQSASPASLEVRIATVGESSWEEAELRLAAELRWEGFRVSRRPVVPSLDAGAGLCDGSPRCLYALIARPTPGQVIAVVARGGAPLDQRLALRIESRSEESFEDMLGRAVGFARTRLLALAERAAAPEAGSERAPEPQSPGGVRFDLQLAGGAELALDITEPLVALRFGLGPSERSWALGLDLRSGARAAGRDVPDRGPVEVWTPTLQAYGAWRAFQGPRFALELDVSFGALLAVGRGQGRSPTVAGRRDAAWLPLAGAGLTGAYRVRDRAWLVLEVRAQRALGDLATREGALLRSPSSAQLALGFRWRSRPHPSLASAR